MSTLKKVAKGLALGASVGFTAGILAERKYQKSHSLSPDKILDQVKKAFAKEGPIEGSWISFDVERFQKFAITMDVLSGGITRKEDTQLVAYEFKADAKTGTVLEIKRSIQ